nr:SDR family oxidoreductase [uncultured Lacibacter sp.]
MNEGYYKEKVVVITGGSSGIGLALSKEFAKQQAQLVLIARDNEKLIEAKRNIEKMGSVTVLTFSADVSDNDAIKAVIDETAGKLGRIDVLINNAGIMTCGRFADQPVKDLEKCVFTNYLGAVYATKAAWPWLKKTNGQLSFVSSVAGYAGLIGYSSYAPSKFAITGLAESLRKEAKDDNIRVSVIYPPDTDTSMLQYERQHTLPESIALSETINVKSAEEVARIYLNGLQKNKFQIYCDFDSRLIRWIKNNFPGLFHYVTDFIVEKAVKRKLIK